MKIAQKEDNHFRIHNSQVCRTDRLFCQHSTNIFHYLFPRNNTPLLGAVIFSRFLNYLISRFWSVETLRMAKVKRGWRGQGIMTDDWRNIDGWVDLVLTRALAMSERQFGMGHSIVTVTDIVTHSVLCHVRWWHVSTFRPCCCCTHRPGRTPDRRPSSWGGRCRRSPWGPGWLPASCKSCLVKI